MPRLIDWEYDSNSKLIAVTVDDDGDGVCEFELVRHGQWIDGRPYTNSRLKVCSECHKSAPYPNGGENYCPECGAKMDGGAEHAAD